MIAVLGPGGVGGLVAAALSQAGERVTVVAREETARHVADYGIRVRSVALGDFRARPAAVAELDEPAEALIVAVKAPALEASLARIRATPGLVVPLLNGVDHLAVLRARFGADRVPAAVIRVESDRPEPGMVVQTSPEIRIDLDGRHPGAAQLAPRLEAAGLVVRAADDEATIMWRKLARLCALALATTAYDLPLGPIRHTPEMWDELAACVRETVAVALAEGARITAPEVLAELRSAHPGLTSSMHRDVVAGREPELDAIAGAVIRAAARHQLRCPTIERLAERIRGRLGGG